MDHLTPPAPQFGRLNRRDIIHHPHHNHTITPPHPSFIHCMHTCQRNDRLNQPYRRAYGRTFRTVWRAAPSANTNMHIYLACLLSDQAKYNHIISSQHLIKWLPTLSYTYGTVRIHLTPPPAHASIAPGCNRPQLHALVMPRP